MARMHPPQFPAAVAKDPRREAEELVFGLLGKQLDNDWCVVYSAHWVCRRDGGRGMTEGETDFILIHPRQGVLFLEVKGGELRVENGEWISRDRQGRDHPIGDPGAQASRGRHEFVRRAEGLPDWGHQRWRHGHAVLFPHCVTAGIHLGTNLPRDIVLDARDLDQLAVAIPRVLKYYGTNSENGPPMTPERARLLERHLRPSLILPEALSASVRRTTAEIERISSMQYGAFSMLRHRRRAAITGGPGTGKTVLAVQAAIHYARNGLRTLLTCFNRQLADTLDALVSASGEAHPNLEIRNFHGVCAETARKAGILLPAPPPDEAKEAARAYWEVVHPEYLLAALGRMPDFRYDAIIVDEGQDFLPEWWTVLQLALNDREDNRLHVYYDPGQDIYRRLEKLPELGEPLPLGVNLRNTQAIHRVVARRFHITEEAKGPEGTPVGWVMVPEGMDVRRAVGNVLTELVRQQGIAPGDIAVLSGHGAQRSTLMNDNHISGVQTTRESRDRDRVVVSSIYSFKGLERPVVVLAELDGLVAKGNDAVLCVGMTRAQAHLVVVGSKAVLENLQGPPPGGST